MELSPTSRAWLLPMLLLAGCGRSTLAHSPDDGGPLDHRQDLPARPDLVLTLDGTTKSPAAVIYIAEVCNNGPVASPPTQIAYYRDLLTAPRPGQPSTLTLWVPALAPAGCTTLQRLEDHVDIGEHKLWAQIDPADTIPESDEGNNVAGPVTVSLTPLDQLPDLTVTLGATLHAPDSVELRAMVCNQGNRPSQSTTVEFYADSASAPSPGTKGLAQTIPSLLNGTCTEAQVLVFAAPGEHDAWARIDRANVVTESSEYNNLAGPATYGSAPPKLADLVVTKLSAFASPSTSYVSYSFTVCNLGLNYSSPSQVDLYLNQPTPPAVGSTGDLSKTLITLASGACVSDSVSTQLPQGTYNSWAMVDPKGAELESDEGNNLAGPISVTVTTTSGADLLVTTLLLTQTGSSHQFTAIVCNQGGSTASSSVLDLYINSPQTPSGLSDGSKIVGQLAAGACIAETFDVGQLSPGTYSSWAWIDRNNYVSEINEGNNLSGPFPFVVN